MTDEPTRSCPRCAGELQPGEFHGVELHLCQACQGSLVDRRRLTPLLERMTDELVEEIAPDQRIEALADDGGELDCPLCGSKMEHFGYMGGRDVYIDACNGCNVLWLDPEELGVMSLMVAQTDRIARDRAARSAAHLEQVERRVHAQLLARAVQRRLMGRFSHLF